MVAGALAFSIGAAFWGDAASLSQYQAGHTFAANPVSAACGLAVIRYIEDHDVLANVRERGAELERRLLEIAKQQATSVLVTETLWNAASAADRAPIATGEPIDVDVRGRAHGLRIRALGEHSS